MGFTRRLSWTVAAVVASATLFFFGTGLSPVAALTWFAPIPLLLLAPRLSGWAAAAAAFTAALLGTANSWSYQARSHDVALVPIGILIDCGTALVFVLTVLLFRALARKGRVLTAAIAASAAWVGAFYVVCVANPTGLVGSLANDQGDVPLVLQTAAVTGMWGVEFLVMFAPAAVAAVCLGDRGWVRLRAGAVAVAVLGLAFASGALRLAEAPVSATRVAAVAPNQYKWAPEVGTPAGRDLVAAYVRQIDSLPAGVKVVVLPEGAFGTHAADISALAEPMRETARGRGIDIVLGLVRYDQRTPRNLALVFPGEGGEPVSYLKHHDTVSVPGHDLVKVPVGESVAGVEICADVDFPSPSRDYAKTGSGFLAVPASDENVNGWQHSRTALLRGVENGQPLVWSDQNGTVLVADGWGRVVAEAHTGGAGPFTTVVANLPGGPGATLYSRFGDWFAWLCLAIALGCALSLVWRGRFLNRDSTRSAGTASPARL
ncbi:nitrilase-related carbon-nitrogen hydrolase [Amycolatopsis pigmentata]|uniref:Nitrilase-related carbon-nitrogen hydrolase n=1 Tax=Amycolatopsis pigmentata TaxID=450801 RepID=A0ABW5FRB1_9PSEU